jgi:hypothetical protein
VSLLLPAAVLLACGESTVPVSPTRIFEARHVHLSKEGFAQMHDALFLRQADIGTRAWEDFARDAG